MISAEIETTIVIPDEILANYMLDAERLQVLGGGLVNSTFLVEGPTENTVIQRLGSVMDPAVVEDMVMYTKHLSANGWQTAEPLPTVDGQLTTRDANDNYWRATRFIASDAQPPQDLTLATAEKLGTLLGRWHRTMAWLDYTPKFNLPHFHDGEYYAQKLAHNYDILPTMRAKAAASAALEAFESLEPLPAAPSQLIHGDPKIDNILFRDGKPLTLIDLDTVMHGPVWLDLGDIVRSMTSKYTLGSSQTDMIEAFALSYYDATRPSITPEQFIDKTLLSARRISLELSMRYLNDIVDADYFCWDSDTYSSRHDHHLAKTDTYIKLSTTLKG